MAQKAGVYPVGVGVAVGAGVAVGRGVGVGLALSWQAAYGTLHQPQALATTIMVKPWLTIRFRTMALVRCARQPRLASTDLVVDACPAGSASDIIQLAAGIYRLNVSSQVSFEFGDLDLNGTIQSLELIQLPL